MAEMGDVEQVKVRDYMSTHVDVASPEDKIDNVIALIEKTGHDGFPVVENGRVIGYISSKDIIFFPKNALVKQAMNKDVVSASPDMNISDAARVMFRTGKSKVPVIDDQNHIVGILTNSDIIRSHIERTTPKKVWKLKTTLEVVHDTAVKVKRKCVDIDKLVPTQPRIYADELQGRMYELRLGLTEPLIVIDKGGKHILVDGHHRVMAARQMGIRRLDAYVLVVDENVPLGMESTAAHLGLKTIDDIKIMDYVKHPLTEITQKATTDMDNKYTWR
ncbi:MAG: CBS domain-containing protein [Methermicoccaceae archaeon]